MITVWMVVTILVLVVITVVAARLWRRVSNKGGLITGKDGRLSTSKLVSLAWTEVAALIVIVMGLTAWEAFGKVKLADGMIYLVLLGGPWAAAAFAKANTVQKLNDDRLQKPAAAKSSAADVIAHDDGSGSLYDFQYVLLNLAGLVVVTNQLIMKPTALPAIPEFLAALLGGSALAYTVNKASEENAAAITDLSPSTARIADRVEITGRNLHFPVAGDADTAKTAVEVGGVPAELLESQGGRLVIKVPAPPASTAWPLTPQTVRVRTNAGGAAEKTAALRIVDDLPRLDSYQPQLPTIGSLLTVTGAFFFAQTDVDDQGLPKRDAAPPAVRLSWQAAGATTHVDLTPSAATPQQLKVAVPEDLVQAALLPLTATLEVRRSGKTSDQLTLVLSDTAPPAVTSVDPLQIRPGEPFAIRGTALTAAAGSGPRVVVGTVTAPVLGTPEPDLVRCRLPQTLPPGPLSLTLERSPGHLTGRATQLMVLAADSKPVIDDISTLSLAGPLPLAGRHMLTVNDLTDMGEAKAPLTETPELVVTYLDKDGTPLPGALTERWMPDLNPHQTPTASHLSFLAPNRAAQLALPPNAQAQLVLLCGGLASSPVIVALQI